MSTRGGEFPWTHGGASGSNGPIAPAWLRRNLDYALWKETETTSWTVQA